MQQYMYVCVYVYAELCNGNSKHSYSWRNENRLTISISKSKEWLFLDSRFYHICAYVVALLMQQVECQSHIYMYTYMWYLYIISYRQNYDFFHWNVFYRIVYRIDSTHFVSNQWINWLRQNLCIYCLLQYVSKI